MNKKPTYAELEQKIRQLEDDAAKREQIDERIMEAKERYNALFDRTLDCIFFNDLEGNFIDANLASLNLLGYTKEEVPFLSYASILDPEDLPRALQMVKDLVTVGPQNELTEFELKHRDGNHIFVETLASLIYRDNKPYAVLGIAREITKRKRAEQALHESEKRYSALFNGITDAILVHYVTDDNHPGRIIEANDIACRMLGYSMEELTGMEIRDIDVPESKIDVRPIVKRLMKGKDVLFEQTHVAKDGTPIPVEVHVQTFDFKGRPAVLSTVRDITDRKQAEMALQASEEKFRSLVDLMSDWLWELDINGIFTYVDPKVKDFLGYKVEEVIGKPFHSLMPEAAKTKGNSFFLEQSKRPAPFRMYNNTNLHRDGSARITETNGIPVFDSEGNLAGWRGVNRDITEQVYAEDALQASEERFRSIVEASSDFIWEVDLNGLFTYISPRIYDILGYKAEEIVGRHFRDIMSAYDHDKASDVFKTSLETLKPFSRLRAVHRHKNGNSVTLEVSSTPIFDAENNLLGFRGLDRDISEEVRAHEELKKSEERFRSLVEHAPDFIFILDRNGIIQFANRTLPQHTLEDLIGTNITDYEVEGNMLEIKKAIEHIFETGEPSRYSGPAMGPYNTISWYDIQMGPIMHKGKIVAATLILTDITERKQAEDNLRTEHDKFQGVLNVIGEGLYIVNRDFDIEYQNKILENIFGRKLNTKCYSTYFKLDEPCKFCPAIETVASGGIKQFEAELSNGRFYDINSSPFIDTDGEVKAIVLLRDITEKQILQAEAMRAGHLASLGELSAGVAHEINNPINGVINYAEILQDEFEEKGKDTDIPRRIIKEGERIAKIVSNLLSFARDQKENRSHANVGEMLSDTLSLVEKQIQKDGIRLIVDVPHNLPAVNVRVQEIQQVFLNLLSNGRHALKQKFPRSAENKILEIKGEPIELEGRQYVRMTFHDNGIGIPTDIIDKICNPFFSTKPKGEGTGLGLSISHGIIKNHGGKLLFKTIEGEFTLAIVDLPEALYSDR